MKFWTSEHHTDSWLHKNQRDLHLILKKMTVSETGSGYREFSCPMAENLLPQALNDWLFRELPETPVGTVRKYVVNSLHYFESHHIPYMDFSPIGLAKYQDVWEDTRELAIEHGFSLRTINYSAWLAMHKSIATLRR